MRYEYRLRHERSRSRNLLKNVHKTDDTDQIQITMHNFDKEVIFLLRRLLRTNQIIGG